MKDKIKVIIIDDEKLAREIVKSFLKKYENIELAAECSNGFDALKQINDINPDIIFLDIQMPKITGFEMLEVLENPPVIIFTTAYDQYALKAFEVNATDYLLKPFPETRFDEAIQKAMKLLANKNESDKKLKDLFKILEKQEEFLERVVIKNGQKISIISGQRC